MRSKDELKEAHQKLQAVYPEVVRQLSQLPGVIKVGIGLKETQGQLEDETVFRVYVRAKKTLADLPPEQVIPPVIQGFKTDVIIYQESQPESEDDGKYRPLKGGIQIGADGSNGVGTLGCFAHLVTDNSVLILSCQHVLYDPPAKDHTDVGQPDFVNCCCCSCNGIASNVHGIKHDHLDCAIAKLKPDIKFNSQIVEIGAIAGIADATAGEAVKKRGRTTGLTAGTITNITHDATGTKILEIEVKTNNGAERFSSPGDSGSALLNAQNEIIGLHNSGNNGPEVAVGKFRSESTGIQEVLLAFKDAGFEITISTGTSGNESLTREQEVRRVGVAPVTTTTVVTAVVSDPLWVLEQRLQSTANGRELYKLFARHSKEVRDLINHTRPVTVMWRRKQGPAYSAALMRSVKEPTYKMPTVIEGVSGEHLLMSMATLLEAHGSDALQRDLQTYAQPVLAAFVCHDTFEEIVQELHTIVTTAVSVTVLL